MNIIESFANVRNLLNVETFFMSFYFKLPAEVFNKISEIYLKRSFRTHHLALE